MADLTLKAGDTWPPLRGRAADSAGTFDLTVADQVLVIIKAQASATIITAAATAIDPLTNDGFNWEYAWQDGDTDEIGTYDVEVEITWDAGTTPPKVQTVPNANFQTVDIVDDLGGDR